MPGVSVSTATRSGPSTSLLSPSGQFFAVGLLERGATSEPMLLRGMSDVEVFCGARPAYGNLYDQLKVFFDEGGLQAQVLRVVGPAATTGTLTLTDRAGTPIATLRVDAASPGAWSSDMKVEVRDGSIANTFRIIVTLGTTVVEDVTNIPNPNEAAIKFSTSPFIRVTALGSASVAPTNNPKVAAATALSAGNDDRAAVTVTNYVAALAKFVPGLGDGAVAIPGQTGATAWQGIIDHCKANNRIALLAAIQNETLSNLKTQAASLDSEHAGLFAPWLVVSDGGYGTRNISPEGFVAACRQRAHEQVGPWRAPAGAMGKANTVLDLAQEWTGIETDDLDNAKVSAIRKVANSIRLYGWRSLSNDVNNYAYLKDRDLLNRLVVQAEEHLEDYVFETIDAKGQLLSSVNAELVGMVKPIADAGGLYPLVVDGRLIDPGYKVETGTDVNTTVSLANNEIRARLLVRISPMGGTITLTIVKVGILSGM